MKVLILSAYNAVSHSLLNKGLEKHLSEIDFTVLTLPARYFAWRARGNSLSFAYEFADELKRGYDHIFATSLTDITALRGLVPEIAQIPLTVYFHENQFEYPESRSEHTNIEAKIVSIYNALAADKVLFNTEYNMNSFLDGAGVFLRKMPDHVPCGLIKEMQSKSEVLSVPIEKMKKRSSANSVPVILWNHRWEYDKGPEGFLNVLDELSRRDFDFRLNILGQTFRQVPDSYKQIKDKFSEKILKSGYIEDRIVYNDIVAESDIIISTSLHDFQGLSVIEGADAGCIPVLPDRLAYPYLFSKDYLYASSKDSAVEASNCADKIINAAEQKAPDMSYFHWENLKDKYRELFK
ncbi:MAG: DUF3524 domain-containing protein [Denitrovibrio sp.]|nr:MAG: DUF3524 domain-containing protein [Denitrovibrio sp.]